MMLQVLIYNGDADACVPYIGNEEWTTGMLQQAPVIVFFSVLNAVCTLLSGARWR